MTRLRSLVETKTMQTAMNLPAGVQRRLAGRPVVLDGQTLSPEIQLMLRLGELAREPHIEDLPLEQARRATVKQARMVGGKLPIGAVRNLAVDGAAGPIRARLYTPTEQLGRSSVPTMLFIHGGGMIYGDLESHDASCRHLAENSGVQLLAVDYRLAPEHVFPAGIDDCAAAYRWLVTNAAVVNADPERLAVGGDSAGAYFSAQVAVTAAEEGLPLAFQLLIYPCTDFSRTTRSQELFRNGFFLSGKFMDQARDGFFPPPVDRTDPKASILLRTDFPAGMAPAHLLTAGFDPLRDEGEAYARLLAEHGVTVDTKRYPSMIHGFFNMVGSGHETRTYNLEIAARLRQALR